MNCCINTSTLRKANVFLAAGNLRKNPTRNQRRPLLIRLQSLKRPKL